MSKLTSLAALLAGMVAAGSAFPVTLELHNTVWRSLVEPESGKEVPGAADGVPGCAAFELRSEDQFVRVLSNVEQINFINGFADGEGLSIAFPTATLADGGGTSDFGQGADLGVGSQPATEGSAVPAADSAPAPAPEAPAPDAPAAPAPTAPAAPSGNKQNRGGSR